MLYANVFYAVCLGCAVRTSVGRGGRCCLAASGADDSAQIAIGTALAQQQIDLYIKHPLELGKSRTAVNRDIQALGQASRLAGGVLSAPSPRDVTRFAHLSGWRENDIANLKWRGIEADVIGRHPQISKTNEGQVLVLARHTA